MSARPDSDTCRIAAALVHQLISFFIPASRTNESIGPTTSCEIPLAGFLRAKVGLELAERLRERRSWHQLNTNYWGLLMQPDNQKLPKACLRLVAICWPWNRPFSEKLSLVRDPAK